MSAEEELQPSAVQVVQACSETVSTVEVQMTSEAPPQGSVQMISSALDFKSLASSVQSFHLPAHLHFSNYSLLPPQEDLSRAIVPFQKIIPSSLAVDAMILDAAVVAMAPACDDIVVEAVVAAKTVPSETSGELIETPDEVETIVSQVLQELATSASMAPEAIPSPAVLDSSSTLSADLPPVTSSDAPAPINFPISKRTYIDSYDESQSSEDEFATDSDDSSATIARKRKARSKAMKRVPLARTTDHDIPYYIKYNCEITEPWMQYSLNQRKAMKKKRKFNEGPSKPVIQPPPPPPPDAGASASLSSNPVPSSLHGKTYQQSRGRSGSQPYQRGGPIDPTSGPYPYRRRVDLTPRTHQEHSANRYEPAIPFEDPTKTPAYWKARMTEMAALNEIDRARAKGLDTSQISTMSDQRREELEKYKSKKFFDSDKYMQLHPAAVPASGKSQKSLGAAEDYRSKKDATNPNREIIFKASDQDKAPKEKMSSPIFTKKLKETSETEEGGERKEESDVEITYEMKETKQEQEGSTRKSLKKKKKKEEKLLKKNIHYKSRVFFKLLLQELQDSSLSQVQKSSCTLKQDFFLDITKPGGALIL
ncbi:hypothetical protein KSP39_PZI017848 [Platanthera zijinensis]|uniref:Uncharacterized protein n=1 Tax=Platanthera zijinensis TaxID=2320716 RepID=A0AAP0B4W1_9ASPA